MRDDAFEPVQPLEEGWKRWKGGFDEINGLKWEARMKLTKRSWDRILDALEKMGIKRGSEIHETLFLSSLPEWEEIIRGEQNFKIIKPYSMVSSRYSYPKLFE